MTIHSRTVLLVAALAAFAGSPGAASRAAAQASPSSGRLQSQPAVKTTAMPTVKATATSTIQALPPGTAKAYFAGGCFWCMEASLEKVPGVVSVISGYTGGQKVNPTYHEVGSGSTGHAESVEVIYDPKKISYAQLLDAFWHNIDPFAANRQFCDAGNQYRSAIFYQNEEEHRLALESEKKVEDRFPGKKVVTQIVASSTFYPAEDYHQDYYKKNPDDYQSYRAGCGRDRRLKELWGNLAGAH